MNKTEWYPANVKPVREGWYEVKGCNGFWECAGQHYWDGFFGWVLDNPTNNWTRSVPALPWRGLTTEDGK